MRRVPVFIAALVLVVPVAAAGTAAKRNVSAGNWHYSTTKDAMGEVTKTTCTMSLNEVHLGFPYGSTKARLCARYSPEHGDPKGVEVYVELVGRGQILASEGVEARFDQTDPQYYEAVGAEDGSEDTVWIDKAYDAIFRLKHSEKTAIKLTYFQAGNQILIFRTGGLNLPEIADTEDEAVARIMAHDATRSVSTSSSSESSKSEVDEAAQNETKLTACIGSAPTGQLQSCFDKYGPPNSKSADAPR